METMRHEHQMMSKSKPTLTEILRQAISDSPSLRAIETATGVSRAQMRDLRNGKRSLRLPAAEALMEYFQIELVWHKPKSRAKKGAK